MSQANYEWTSTLVPVYTFSKLHERKEQTYTYLHQYISSCCPLPSLRPHEAGRKQSIFQLWKCIRNGFSHSSSVVYQRFQSFKNSVTIYCEHTNDRSDITTHGFVVQLVCYGVTCSLALNYSQYIQSFATKT